MAQNNSLNKSSEDFTVDNLFLDGNTISTTNTNGDLVLDPDGTGNLSVLAPATVQNYANAGNFTFNRTYNSDNTNAASHALVEALAGGTSGGDPFFRATVSATNSYAIGIDNSDTDALKMNYIASGAATPSSGTNYWKMTTAGERTMPLQPAFLVTEAGGVSNVTGNNTQWTITYDVERYDQGGDYDTGTYTFTAPVTGRYQFGQSVRLNNFGAATQWNQSVQTSNRNYFTNEVSPANILNGTSLGLTMTCMSDMDAADTASFTVTVNGTGADTVDLTNDIASNYAFGTLIC